MDWSPTLHTCPFKNKEWQFVNNLPFTKIDSKYFDLMINKSNDYYILIKSIKVQFPNNSRLLKRDFNLSDDQLKRGFTLPHTIATEPYIKAFQYKVLNSILYTNTKLYKN